jgi:TonB family protein
MSMIRVMATTLVTGTLLVLPADAFQGADETPVLRVYDKSTPGLVLPKVVKSQTAYYTAAAMHERIRGGAAIDLTVGVDGKVRDVLLVTSLDPEHGLDEAALTAAGRYVFTPATLNGQPVPVRVRIDMHFTLK